MKRPPRIRWTSLTFGLQVRPVGPWKRPRIDRGVGFCACVIGPFYFTVSD